MSNSERNFSLRNGVIEFMRPAKTLASTWVRGPVINSVTERKEALQEWKVKVASAVKKKRGETPWNPHCLYAVTLEFLCHPANHGYQRLDVENFIKPVIDALAAGLFCEECWNPCDITTWGADDSNFNTLLIHRHPDPETPDEEGVHLFVSSTRQQ